MTRAVAWFQSIEDFVMQDNCCPYCTGEILESVFLCKHCGRDLHAMRIAHLKAEAASNTEQGAIRGPLQPLFASLQI